MRPIVLWMGRVLEFLLAACLLLIATMVVALVVVRYFTEWSITGGNELITILFAFTTSIGAAVVVGRREHIAIPFFVERLPAPWLRMVDLAELIGVAVINVVMAVYSIAWIGKTGEFLMPSTGLPRAAAQVCVPIGCSLAVAFCILRLFAAPLPHDEEDRHERNAP